MLTKMIAGGGDWLAMWSTFKELKPPRGYVFSPDGVGRIQVLSPAATGGSHVHGYLRRDWAQDRMDRQRRRGL